MSSMAMAYNMKKRSKMASGGMCKHNSSDCPECHGGMMAEGGEMKPDDDDLVMSIMKKRYSLGGRVANETGILADFKDAQYDDLPKDDDLEFSETGANSGDEIGDEQEDEDRKDIVDKIMKSRSKKDKMPRPA